MGRIFELQKLMRSRGIFAYIVPTEDFHGSEYVGEHFRLREYLSGFTGSAGTLVVTLDNAALWTDGRYFIQAERELSGSVISLMKSGEPNVPTIEQFLQDSMPEKSFLGFDGRIVSADFACRLKKKLSQKNIQFKTDEDLGGLIWEKRPPLSRQPVIALPERLCGLSRTEKLSMIREKMREKKADCLALSALDEIAWTLNLRGGDVEFNPVFLSFLLVFEDKAWLFAERSIFSEEIAQSLINDGVEIRPYDDIYSALGDHCCNVWTDPKAVNFRFLNSLEDAKLIENVSPIALMKSVKNAAEISAEKCAHLKDGVAVTRFIRWLKSAVLSQKITEVRASEKLLEFRRMGENFLGESFAPIVAYGANAAIVHYSANEATNTVIEPRGLLLCDTGAHYLEGTTDVTRTFVLGELSSEEKRVFTLVLAGHLELLHARFPEGVRGSVLDYAAREPLWKHFLDFNHGTGHGVGFLLNVHEGPQRISWKAVGDAPLKAGMITSDEPGLYVEGRFGIRHESLLLCEKSQQSEFGQFLEFSALTLVPFDREGVDPQYLTPRQITYFNDYQKLVFDRLSPLLSEEERAWLAEVTKPI